MQLQPDVQGSVSTHHAPKPFHGCKSISLVLPILGQFHREIPIPIISNKLQMIIKSGCYLV